MSYDAVLSKKNTHELVKVNEYPNVLEKLNEFNNEEQYLTSTTYLL